MNSPQKPTMLKKRKKKPLCNKRRQIRRSQDREVGYSISMLASLDSSTPGGQDPPRDSPCSDFYNQSTSHSQCHNSASLISETELNGVHPSRLGLFAVGKGDDPQDMATAAVMAPPRYDGRHSQSHTTQHSQPKIGSNSHNLNGLGQQTGQSKAQITEKNQRPQTRDDSPTSPIGKGPMPNHIQVAKPYVFQQAIEGCLKDVGVPQTREDSIRLAGVQWIDNVRRALKLPVRTFDTAVVYFHKFRLVHSDSEYSFVDAAAASLFAACKIEDTLKKSRDILCAAHNLKIPNRAEHVAPDDSMFEHSSRTIIGLERLMLESSSFDFRNRHPQQLLMKVAKSYSISNSSPVMKTAYKISLDLYRTFAPLKHCTATLVFACLELSARLLKESENHSGLKDIISGVDYGKWRISRAEVMETMLDLLELYTIYRNNTVIGLDVSLDTFLEVRIPLNEELNEKKLPRFTEYIDPTRISGRADVGSYAATVNGVSAADTAANGLAKHTLNSASPAGKAGQNGIRQKAGERGKEGTVRFMLNPDREREERAVIASYGPIAGHGGGQQK